MANSPTAGQVFRYPFLWKREEASGETEGRKKRPVCIAVSIARREGETIVFVLPITTQPPLPARQFIEVPQIEAQRVGLDTHVRKWIMLDEINTDLVERSYVWDDRKPLGAFSPAFTAKIRTNLLALAKAGAVRAVDRTK